ncbi:hypothetical protein BIW11_13342 [Tropilaelaps mercedesae]|uniref:Uncharacterized protein n=1 Tax=Tropilaelaps mercedesae TaxID=418985 RepID=A0A1V9X2W5_9ACAR|nr:hypothetical protein BIW11_13342 [Tropilaelaps mercedesae]
MEDDWIPPTEGELKVIEARRERNEKISSVMGGYLLRGYKMLDQLHARSGAQKLAVMSGDPLKFDLG